jgi:23S rRNA (adenine2503-C2)-methyltransferase
VNAPPRNLFGLDLRGLEAVVSALGEPPFRARQLYAWLYRKRVGRFADMSNLGKRLRERLAEHHRVQWPELIDRQLSYDGTRKYLFRLDDAANVESVYIPEERRRTICISTQAGCPLKCAFCLTGIAGYTRNLTAAEILGQVAAVMHEEPPREMAWNIVVMGMGEPLLNYEATVAALRILMDPEAFAVAPRRLTLSTVGILPALERLANEPVRPNLAISLHAPTAELRRRLMPIEEKYGIEQVVAAAQRYPIPRGGLVTYEYVLLRGVNDAEQDALSLVRLLKGSRAKVNLIPLNPAPAIPFEPPTEQAVEAFCRILSKARFTVSVRRSRGPDILAACGQLHLKERSRSAAGRAQAAASAS